MPYFNQKDIAYFLGKDQAKQFIRISPKTRDAEFYKKVSRAAPQYYARHLDKSPMRDVIAYIFKSWAAVTYRNAYAIRPQIEKIFEIMYDEEIYSGVIPIDMVSTAHDAAVIMEEIHAGHKILSFAHPDRFRYDEDIDIPRMDILIGLAESGAPDYKLDMADMEDIGYALDLYIDNYVDNARSMKITARDKAALAKSDNIANLLAAEPNGYMKTKVLDWIFNFYNVGSREYMTAANQSIVEIKQKLASDVQENNPKRKVENDAELLQECVAEKIKSDPKFAVLKDFPVAEFVERYANYTAIAPAIAGHQVTIGDIKDLNEFDAYAAGMGLGQDIEIIDYMQNLTFLYTKTALERIGKNTNLILELRPTAQHFLQNFNQSMVMNKENDTIATMGMNATEYQNKINKLDYYKQQRREMTKRELARTAGRGPRGGV